MTSRSTVLTVSLALIWVMLFAAVWAFPTILSIYGLLWILLPCQLVYIGFKSGIRFQSVRLKIAMVFISGACEAIATIVIGVMLNGFRGWNIYFQTVDYLIIGVAASLIGLLLSSLVRRDKVERKQR